MHLTQRAATMRSARRKRLPVRRRSSGRVLYNRFRYYDPSIGSYISADPIGQLGGTNVYAYALNSPVNLTDPFGLWTVSVGVNVSGAVGIGGGGGTSINFGYNPGEGLSGFSASITGTASVAAAAAADAGVGITVSATNEDDVSGLLGESSEVTVGGIGPLGGGTILDDCGNPVGGFFGFQLGGLGGLGVGSVSKSTTSAIVQGSSSGVQVGTDGKTSIWSSN